MMTFWMTITITTILCFGKTAGDFDSEQDTKCNKAKNI